MRERETKRTSVRILVFFLIRPGHFKVVRQKIVVGRGSEGDPNRRQGARYEEELHDFTLFLWCKGGHDGVKQLWMVLATA